MKAIALRIGAAAASACILCFPLRAPATGTDRAVVLYLCQTERELEQITAWEYADPDRYRTATKNGSLMPVDAARERAAFLVSTDRVTCDAENRLSVEKADSGKIAAMVAIEGPALEAYCPRTLKKHGHPCR
jgi:hypothetical protein